MKTIKWGIIGCGDVTEVKSGPGFHKANHSELVAVMRRSRDKAKDYAKRHNVPKWYDDAQKLINNPEVDIVYIATPPDSHKYYTLLAASAGKNVYVEKPMARCFNECQEMIKACDKAKVSLFTAYYRRSLPTFLKVKELIDNNSTGEIRFVRTIHSQPADQNINSNLSSQNWRFKSEISGGGLFVDLACHTLDILDFFFGPVTEVNGFADNQAGIYPTEDIVTANLKFEKGIVGSGIWCFSAFQREDITEIIGDKGKIQFATFMQKPVKLINGQGEQSWEFERPQHIQQQHIQSIVNELNGHGKCPSDGISGARTSRMIDEILKEWRKKTGLRFR